MSGGGGCSAPLPNELSITGEPGASTDPSSLFCPSDAVGGLIGVSEKCPRGSWVSKISVKSQFSNQDDMGVIGQLQLCFPSQVFI